MKRTESKIKQKNIYERENNKEKKSKNENKDITRINK